MVAGYSDIIFATDPLRQVEGGIRRHTNDRAVQVERGKGGWLCKPVRHENADTQPYRLTQHRGARRGLDAQNGLGGEGGEGRQGRENEKRNGEHAGHGVFHRAPPRCRAASMANFPRRKSAGRFST